MTTSFDIRPLTSDEVRRLYGERLTADFPPDEVKSLGVIEGAIARGGYACYGAVRGGEILAYAFFVIRAPHALFDYYAVRADLRDTGVGSRFIRALMDGPLQACDCVLLEVDDPDAADSPAERAHRERRLRFYLRNGLVETGVTANVWHVDYRILALPVGRGLLPRAETQRIYSLLYQSMMPPDLFKKMFALTRSCVGGTGGPPA